MTREDVEAWQYEDCPGGPGHETDKDGPAYRTHCAGCLEVLLQETRMLALRDAEDMMERLNDVVEEARRADR